MKTKKLLILLPVLMAVLLAGCGPKYLTKKEAFPNVYEEKPISVLVLPPINETTAADAKEYYLTTIAEPLSLVGYYIFPIEVVNDLLKMQGGYDTEALMGMPVQKFRDFAGADAVLFIKIKNWDTHYYVLGGNVTVSVYFLMKSTVTGQDLWQYNGTMVVDTSGGNTGGGLGGLLAKAIVTAIKTAATDYVPVAKQANSIALASIPYGKYHALFYKDMDMKVVQQANVQEHVQK
jgi:hypothetical protein